jgi:platelet-activating factor acetylhydrolase IB subunit alpha
MVLTDRQRADLHVGIYEYLVSRGYDQVAEAFRYADPTNLAQQQQQQNNNINNNGSSNNTTTKTPLLEKKWTAIPRLQKKVLELERTLAQSAKIHAHRTGLSTTGAEGGDQRRMLPRQPCLHQLSGHAQVVTSVALHPVFTVVVSGSEDGTVKVRNLQLVESSLATLMTKYAYTLLLLTGLGS